MPSDGNRDDTSRTSLFGDHAELYARYRPTYPDELYDFLVQASSPCRVVLDCAAGNGQAALDLAERVDRVVATDISEEQLARAESHPRVEYRHAPAEDSGLPSDSVDLVTVAAALHWFDFDSFYDHIREVVREGGILAAWSYRTMRVDQEVNACVQRMRDEVVDSHWNPRIEYNWEAYETIPFPFRELETPTFAATMNWELDQFLGFISTWSGVQQHIEDTGENPVETMRQEFEEAWGDLDSRRRVTIPLHMRVGVVKPEGP